MTSLRLQGESERRMPMAMAVSELPRIKLTLRVKRGAGKGRVKVVMVKQSSRMVIRRLSNKHMRAKQRASLVVPHRSDAKELRDMFGSHPGFLRKKVG